MATKFNYGNVASVSRRRTKFPDNWNVKTSMTVGKLYPIKWQEVLPGDDFSEDLSFVARLTSTYVRPVFENLQLSVYAFFVPLRILYDRLEYVFGNPKPTSYGSNVLENIPTFSGNLTVTSKSVADYLELPVGTIRQKNNISVLPFRAFAMIWNEWFRDQNNVPETFVSTGEHPTGNPTLNNPNSQDWSATNYLGMLPSVKKFPDYFTTAVPQPQKGLPVTIGASVFPAMKLPVYTTNSPTITGTGYPGLMLKRGDGADLPSMAPLIAGSAVSGSPTTLMTNGAGGSTGTGTALHPANLEASIPETSLQSVTVDEFRLAMQKQLMLVADTMYGSRYREYILGHYGVNMRDERAAVPEFLCGKSIPLGQQQVASTSSTASINGSVDNDTGDLSSYSYTASKSGRYFKGFYEHGYVFWVGCLRYKHTYQQGISKKWMRQERDEFFDPLYSHIGYQPIYTAEIFGTGDVSSDLKDNVFGYQEAWSEYKHTPSVITGQVRSGITDSLDVYHWADYYSTPPFIGQSFVEETPVYLNRSLAVSTEDQDPFVFDFYCKSMKTRVMPLNCVPGYADHWFK